MSQATTNSEVQTLLNIFFEDLKTEINIQCYKTLSKTNQARIFVHQARLIDKVTEFESICLELQSETVNEDMDSDFQATVEQIKAVLKRPDVSMDELNKANGLLSDKLLKIEKVIFQNKSLLFVKACHEELHDKIIDNSIARHLGFLSKKLKDKNLFGLLILLEDCFIGKEEFYYKKYD